MISIVTEKDLSTGPIWKPVTIAARKEQYDSIIHQVISELTPNLLSLIIVEDVLLSSPCRFF